LKEIGHAVEKAVKEYSPDVVFTINTLALAYCEIKQLVVCRMDTNLKGHHDQWPIFSQLEYFRMLQQEKRALKNVSLVITYSDWSSRILQEYYKLPAQKIFVMADPASLPEKAIPRIFEKKTASFNPLRLLLVGRNYRRKGIDIAIEVVELLNDNQIPAELHIVGLNGENSKHVRYLGLFNKTNESQLAAYLDEYRWAHFLLHPSRFDPGGIVASESAAFGTPTITNSSGGMATTVKDGVSGIVLPMHSKPQDYVEALKKWIHNPEQYELLSKSTFQRFSDDLNWQVAGNRIFQQINKIVEQSGN
jgi:glycosyltransferase involved in cell wall biosynthesis